MTKDQKIAFLSTPLIESSSLSIPSFYFFPYIPSIHHGHRPLLHRLIDTLLLSLKEACKKPQADMEPA